MDWLNNRNMGFSEGNLLQQPGFAGLHEQMRNDLLAAKCDGYTVVTNLLTGFLALIGLWFFLILCAQGLVPANQVW
jgi:hypothetical protein